jgi:hypothetical protein
MARIERELEARIVNSVDTVALSREVEGWMLEAGVERGWMEYYHLRTQPVCAVMR